MALYSTAVLVIFGVGTSLWTFVESSVHALAFKMEFVDLAFRRTPLGLIFPVVAALPFVLATLPLISDRFLVYTRPRVALRTSLLRLYGGAALTTFVVMALVALCVVLTAQSSSITYDPAGYGYVSEAEVAAAASSRSNFAQLLVFGEWAYYAMVCVWLGWHGAAYAMVALSSLLLVPNRVIGLLLPWIAFIVLSFGMAALGLGAYSPLAVTPFNFTQLPLGVLAVPAVAVGVVAVGLMLLVVRVRDRLVHLQ